MYSEEEIFEIIKRKIETDEKLGDQTGGSGHLGFVTYTINDYVIEKISVDQIKISYTYTIFIETEFTYYPDNPPQEYKRKNDLIVQINE